MGVGPSKPKEPKPPKPRKPTTHEAISNLGIPGSASWEGKKKKKK